MSTTSQQGRELSTEVSNLKRQVSRLVSLLAALSPGDPVGQSSFTIPQWCRKHHISRAHYYRLKKRRKAPRTMEADGLVRITPEADRDWMLEREAEAAIKAAADIS
jgi:hypothetical protein